VQIVSGDAANPGTAQPEDAQKSGTAQKPGNPT